MAYTALENMRQRNQRRFGADLGPVQPRLNTDGEPDGLRSAALRFLHERCEGLLFDEETEAREERTGIYEGRSLRPGQIPYNMQRDIDRLCLERSLESFIDSGSAEDAYTVYYCYLEMFLGRYGGSKKMVELLSEYESNGSSLLMKHRDHYAHSVYVFALGLAIYETNAAFRGKFAAFYGLDAESAGAANRFLEFWGLTALFHDIGYPFELPFEQVLSYFEVEHKKRNRDCLYLSYRNVETVTALDDRAKARFRELYGREFGSITQVFARDLAARLGEAYGFTEEQILSVIDSKPVSPERFGLFMDHAFFSAVRLYRELAEELGPEKLTAMHMDAMSAILLHNSLFKFSVGYYKDPVKRKAPLRAELHPLAWMLMLCDELQCWDRTAYGRNSRTELHPMGARFDFSGGGIAAEYYYDRAEHEKIDAFRREYRAWENGGEVGDPPRLKAFSDMAEKEQRFTADIRKIVDLTDTPLSAVPGMREVDRSSKHTYLSNSNFLHLYDFAVAIHARNVPPETTPEEMEKKFEQLSLEYQLSVINRAKHFSRYLDAVDCFYTDKPVDYEMVTEFTLSQAAVFAPLEHERWIREHAVMGWMPGDEYETLPLPPMDSAEAEKAARRALREQLRRHKLAMDPDVSEEEIREHFFALPLSEQEKDWKPFNSMLGLLKKFDGLRIYRL